MCGFFGVLSKTENLSGKKARIMEVGKKLLHRGPDDEGVYVDERWGVYFRRLSIIDTSDMGHQPMLSDDKRFVIAFNGEIYNYTELRDYLVKKGYSFRTNSDTEVLLKSFEHFGSSCTEHLRGMFAFTVWDTKRQELHIYRDRLGIKPLYIYEDKNFYAISSEIKCILEYVPHSRAVDENTVFKYLAKGWLDDSDATFFRYISSVPPATYIRIAEDSVIRQKYWSLSCEGDRDFNIDEFNHIFLEAMSLHLRSDVPVATTLSGGMDSSSVTAVANSVNDSPYTLQAFSVIPPETLDESSWIERTVEYTGVKHSYLGLDFKNIPQVVSDVLNAHDEPFQSSSCIYQYLLRRAISKEKIKVLLVGEGGDEVFGGYRRMLYPFLFMLLKEEKIDEYSRAIKGAVDFMEVTEESIRKGLNSYEEIVLSRLSGQENITAYNTLASEFINAHTDIVERSHYPQISDNCGNYFFAHTRQHLFERDLPYVLRMEDRNSMAFSIEARVPFLDHKLLETVFKYKYVEFMENGRNKAMLRKAMEKYLPLEVVQRKTKSPRPGNNAHFIYKILGDEMLDLLHSGKFRKGSILKSDCEDAFQLDRNNYDHLSAEKWFRIYVFMKWFSECTLQ